MISDEKHMQRTLELARAGVGLASPNPAVGALVLDSNGAVVGSGTHTYDGVKHAEMLALEQAGARALGGTLYLNLEPCSHHGRTGPCADAVIAAGVRHVVAAMQDPNPQVAGRGFARLREAGIQVDVGLFAAEARKLNEGFAKYIRQRNPLVTLKSALTLDGKIASDPSRPTAERWITGPAARAHVQQLRHASDAILVGVGTVLADDPLLTDRSTLPRRRNLLRVVLDSHLRTPPGSRLIQSNQNDVLVFYTSAEENRIQTLRGKGIRLEKIDAGPDARPDFAALVRRLGELEITSLLIEGGSRFNAAALASGEVDKIFLYFAPKIFGRGVPFACAEAELPQPRPMHSVELHQFGDDLAIESYLRDPYQS